MAGATRLASKVYKTAVGHHLGRSLLLVPQIIFNFESLNSRQP